MLDDCQQCLWGVNSETGHDYGRFLLIWILTMNNYMRPQHRKKEHGQNLLEFALVLPMLAIVVFGVLDLGRVFFATISLTNAAREGVRFLTIHPNDISNEYEAFWGAKSAAIDEANYSGISVSASQVDVICSNADSDDYCDSGSPASVTVTYDFDLVLGWVLPTPITLTRSAVMLVP
jgi:Flp pilus assembly protein TadG